MINDELSRQNAIFLEYLIPDNDESIYLYIYHNLTTFKSSSATISYLSIYPLLMSFDIGVQSGTSETCWRARLYIVGAVDSCSMIASVFPFLLDIWEADQAEPQPDRKGKQRSRRGFRHS